MYKYKCIIQMRKLWVTVCPEERVKRLSQRGKPRLTELSESAVATPSPLGLVITHISQPIVSVALLDTWEKCLRSAFGAGLDANGVPHTSPAQRAGLLDQKTSASAESAIHGA
jgi:hypothetical protein